MNYIQRSELISKSDRHLKWEALGYVEYALSWVVGLLLAAFVGTTLVDVLTRVAGQPIRWLQEATLITFIWGIFVGAAVGVRRDEHFYLSRTGLDLTGGARLLVETAKQLIMLAISLAVAAYGSLLFLRGFGNTLPATKLPLSTLTGALPVFGVLCALFTLERMVNGWRKGFQGRVPDESVQPDAGDLA